MSSHQEDRLPRTAKHDGLSALLVEAFRDEKSRPARYCIVTEYARGGDLARAVSRRKAKRAPWSEHELLGVLVQVGTSDMRCDHSYESI